MKVTIEIDLTPQEARAFFGLPDVEGLNQAMMDEVRKRMEQGMEGYEPLNLMRPYFNQNAQVMDAMQKAFWGAFTSGSRQSSDKDDG